MGDLRQDSVDGLRVGRAERHDAEDPHIELTLARPFPIALQLIVGATRAADRGEARAVPISDHRQRAGFELLFGRGGNLGGNRACAVLFNDAGRLSCGIAHNPFVGHGVKASGLDCPAVEIASIVGFLQHHWIVRSNLIELVPRKRLLIVGELVMAPASEREDPLAWSRRSDLRPQHLDRLLTRFDAVKTHFLGPGFARAHEMRVVIDQSGNNGLSPEVDPSGAWSRELGNLWTGADRHNAVAPDSYRLSNRKTLVDGDDFSVREYEIRSGLLRTNKNRRARDRRQRNDHYHSPMKMSHGILQWFRDLKRKIAYQSRELREWAAQNSCRYQRH